MKNKDREYVFFPLLTQKQLAQKITKNTRDSYRCFAQLLVIKSNFRKEKKYG